MKDTLNEILAFHTSQPVEKIANDTDRDFIMGASQAVEYGIIDSVISKREKEKA
jgi:ATP-dependent Clp protease protease subunit